MQSAGNPSDPARLQRERSHAVELGDEQRDDFRELVADMLSPTSTEYAPWYVILEPPKVDPARKREVAAARKELMAEKS